MSIISSCARLVRGRSGVLAGVALSAIAMSAQAQTSTASEQAAASPPASTAPAAASAPAAGPDAAQAPAATPAAPAAAAATPAPGAAPASPASLKFSDARPAPERKTRQYLTLWRFSCSFGIQDLGDEFVDRVGQLRHDLIAAYGDRLANSTIVVDHYHMYLNQRAMQGEHNVATAFLGVLAIAAGADAKTTTPACPKEKMPEGWFDPAELTTPWSPFVAEVEIHVDSQTYKVHSVFSPPKNMPAFGIVGASDVKAEQVAVHEAVDKANAAVVAEIGKQFQVSPTVASAASVQ